MDQRNVTGKLQTGFGEFILKPLKILHDAIQNGQKDIYFSIIESLRLTLNDEDLTYLNESNDYKEIFRFIMSKWIPVSNVLFDLMINHLPSPINASLNKYKKGYTGPWNTSAATDWIKYRIKDMLTEYDNGAYLFAFEIICQYVFDQNETNTSVTSDDAVGMKYCKNDSALIMYITKSIPIHPIQSNNFIAVGRVFSGTLRKDNKSELWCRLCTWIEKRFIYQTY